MLSNLKVTNTPPMQCRSYFPPWRSGLLTMKRPYTGTNTLVQCLRMVLVPQSRASRRWCRNTVTTEAMRLLGGCRSSRCSSPDRSGMPTGRSHPGIRQPGSSTVGRLRRKTRHVMRGRTSSPHHCRLSAPMLRCTSKPPGTCQRLSLQYWR